MNIQNSSFSSIEQMTERLQNDKQSREAKKQTLLQESKISFEQVFALQRQPQEGKLKFSKHANERLLHRNIDLSESQLMRLETGAKKASEKGMKESLVLVDDLAFIVNVKNKTVVTAVNEKEERVFTNIDGAVIT